MGNVIVRTQAKREEPSPKDESNGSSPILVPGHTCWRIEPAERAAFLVDGEAYFKAFRDAALRAKHSIRIVGWDIDTQVELVRDEHPSSDMPTKLGEFLRALLRRRRKLRVYVLNWDYAVIYALERQWMPTAEPGWRRHRRLSYQVDDHHPVGASHHQKLVVIDDAVAFVGCEFENGSGKGCGQFAGNQCGFGIAHCLFCLSNPGFGGGDLLGIGTGF